MKQLGLKDYHILKKLRKAIYGKVVVASCPSNDKLVAIKMMKKSCVDLQIPAYGSGFVFEDALNEAKIQGILSERGGHRHGVFLSLSFLMSFHVMQFANYWM